MQSRRFGFETIVCLEDRDAIKHNIFSLVVALGHFSSDA